MKNILQILFYHHFILVFDNIDLCSAKFQKIAVKYFTKLTHDLSVSWVFEDTNQPKLRLLMTTRVDTLESWKTSKVLDGPYPLIHFCDFPKPNIYNVVKYVYREAVAKIINNNWKTYKILPHMKILLHGELKPVKTQNELVDYVSNTVFGAPEKAWHDFMTTDFHAFHNYLVNYNIRRFGLFIMRCISSGSYEPMENRDKPAFHFSRFDYMKMLLAGAEKHADNYVHNNVLYYNERNLPEGGRVGFPVFFNLFETYMLRSESENIYYEDVFMIYIRILQYIWGKRVKRVEGNDTYILTKTIIKDLEPYFKKTPIENALKMLIYTGILNETGLSSRNWENVLSWDEVKLEEDGVLARIDFPLAGVENRPLCSGAAHLQFFLVEYEYVAFHSRYYVKNSESALRCKALAFSHLPLNKWQN